MSERELIGLMAAKIYAGKLCSEQEATDAALCILDAVDRRLYPSMYSPPQAPATVP